MDVNEEYLTASDSDISATIGHFSHQKNCLPSKASLHLAAAVAPKPATSSPCAEVLKPCALSFNLRLVCWPRCPRSLPLAFKVAPVFRVEQRSLRLQRQLHSPAACSGNIRGP
jgi:hypothetical protein